MAETIADRLRKLEMSFNAHQATCDERGKRIEDSLKHVVEHVEHCVETTKEPEPTNVYGFFLRATQKFGIAIVALAVLTAVLYWQHLERTGQAAKNLQEIRKQLEKAIPDN